MLIKHLNISDNKNVKVNIISRDNGVGLSRDISIIRDNLNSIGAEVNFYDFKEKRQASGISDVNIFVELIQTSFFNKAKFNILIPNPEWYDFRWKMFLSKFNLILCKTKSAVSTFQTFNKNCQFVSFTSQDRYNPTVKKENVYLHLAGKSGQKGTDVVYDTWKDNPDFPKLILIQDPSKCNKKSLNNVTVIPERLSDDELKNVQNRCLFHVCPSETEGFGHYIMEGLSCKAIVITTDAPPMNEHIASQRGLLCQWENKRRQMFATNYYINKSYLESCIKSSFEIKSENQTRMMENSRRYYIENDFLFRSLFLNEMKKVKEKLGIK